MIYKSSGPVELKVDVSKRTITAIASKMEIEDLGADIIHRGAFKKTLKERLPKNRIKFMFGHRELLGLMIDGEEDGDNLITVNRIDNITRGDEILTHIEAKTLNEMSIGFDIPRGKFQIREDEDNEGKILRDINEVILFENSIVLWGMNPETAVLSVKMANQVGITNENIDAHIKSISEAEKMESITKHSILSMLHQIKKALEPTAEEPGNPTPAKTVVTQEKDLLDLSKSIEELRGKFNG